MRNKDLRIGGINVIAILLALVLLIGINLAMSGIPSNKTQIDITENELYTISGQTAQLAESLTDDVWLYWIVASGNENGTLQLLLNQFDSLSEHIKVEKIDPNVFPAFSAPYTDNEGDDLANSVAVVCGDRYQYMEYLDFYDVDMEAYSETGDISYKFSGEDTLAAAIDYVSREDLPVLYVMSGHGETEIPNTYKTTIKRDNIGIRDFSFLDTGHIPEDCDVLLICAPKSDLSENEAAELRSYLDGGGKLLLVTQISSDDSALTKLLSVIEPYGLVLNPGIVTEPDPSRYAYSSPYYIVPEMTEHEITAPVKNNNYEVMLPLAQGLTDSGKGADSVSVEPLLMSSEQSFSKLKGFELQSYEKEEGDLQGPFLLGAAVSDKKTGAQIVWYPSKNIAEYDTDIRVSGANQELFVNSINWMCSSARSIEIHSKDLGYSFLTISSSMSSILSVIFVAVIPLLYVTVGAVISLKRRRK